MKRCVIGILAHVDAGKTTLSEALLYSSGAIDKLGRVDKRDAFLDTYSLERERGITIFSKQAELELGDTALTLIDTPGHVDFSAETERTLAVEDYAILVISAPDGVRSHTKTLWELLRTRRIPTFIFVNKCDISDRARDELLAELKTVLSPSCVDFNAEGTPSFFENAAGCDERLMDEYFTDDTLSLQSIAEAVRRRSIFPCYFGSALKLSGVRELMRGIDKYTLATEYSPSLFGAKIYKIKRDSQGRRLSFAKITGGSLRPKDSITVVMPDGAEASEKIEEIRVYSGDKSRPVKEARAGLVCALIGPEHTRAGMGLGIEANDTAMLSPVLDYRLVFPGGESPHELYPKLALLAEEDPTLNLKFETRTGEIRVSLMGEIQLEVLRQLIAERIGVKAEFDEGKILYRETLADIAYGAGHFEPLRHYAEVHLRLEPLEEGSGVIASAECDRDELSLNWQRLVMTHIEERIHKGTSIGAPLTDVKITLIAGRAHQKHTEGGDFRQATYRAIRQAMRKAGTVILEPTFNFRIELPLANMGRALTDLSNMHGSVTGTETNENTAVIEGNCPVLTMRSYPSELRAYTRGEGRITMAVGAYVPAHNPEEVIAERAYDPDLDERNPSGSVFCRMGAGYTVPWYEADALMHLSPDEEAAENESSAPEAVPERARAVKYTGTAEEDKELMRIFEATYGKPKPRTVPERVVNEAKPAKEKRSKPKPRGDEYIILDGYNVIFAWDELKRLAELDFSLARDALVRIVCNYTAYRHIRGIVVFDAYRRVGGLGSVEKCGNATVVYTKEAETADTYIERATYEIAPTNYVRVVTSDLEEQYIILGNGALRVSAAEFKRECEMVTDEIAEVIDKYTRLNK